MTRPLQSAVRWLAAGAAFAAAGYGTYVAVTWSRYGRPAPPRPDEQDELLDRFMPAFEIVERHHVTVPAPADVAFAAAKNMSMSSSPGVRLIFKARELLMGAAGRPTVPRGLIDELLALGWGVLDEIPDRAIVMGAVTRPWESDVTFRAVPPDTFATFSEPGYVKIAWTLRVDAESRDGSIVRTETRALATDADARARFRRYWSLLSPGILMIRRLMLRSLQATLERAASDQATVDVRGATGRQIP